MRAFLEYGNKETFYFYSMLISCGDRTCVRAVLRDFAAASRTRRRHVQTLTVIRPANSQKKKTPTGKKIKMAL